VKIDGEDGLEGSTFEDRSEIQKAMGKVLMPKKLGAVTGGGTGLRYSYVDVALEDVTRGIAAIRQVLSKGKIPKRSWIALRDATLANEWVGVYSDAPEPPSRAGA